MFLIESIVVLYFQKLNRILTRKINRYISFVGSDELFGVTLLLYNQISSFKYLIFICNINHIPFLNQLSVFYYFNKEIRLLKAISFSY